MWFENLTGQFSPPVITANDRLDFFMAVDSRWRMPSDRSKLLRVSIGTENIRYYTLNFNDGQPPAAILHLNDVKIRHLAEFLSQMDISNVTSTGAAGETWRLSLAGDLSEYTGVGLYLNNSLQLVIPIPDEPPPPDDPT